MFLKKDFPIFKNNPWLVFLDSTASSQKPQIVIDWIKDYLENNYSNIHRWAYSLAENSEVLYEKSKKKVALFIGADSWREVIYTYNANYALNLLSSTLKKSLFLKKGDKVLLSIVEHHSNIVPWLILKEEIWIEIDYIKVDSEYNLDLEDLKSKLDWSVKVVSLTQVSNVTWKIFDLEKVGEIIKNFRNRSQKSSHPELVSGSLMQWNIIKQSIKDAADNCSALQQEIITYPLFIVDASQSFPHFKVDVKKINCDAMFFTAHKVMADSWLWVLWAKKDLLLSLEPSFCWWWSIAWVKQDKYKSNNTLPDRFEPGTPNITWAVSLLKALEYIENIWWYEKIEEIEKDLVSYTIEKWKIFLEKYDIKLLWSLDEKNRVWVFSFLVKQIHSLDLADYLAQNNICIRAGQHCAEPFLESENCVHTCRISLYIYNDKEDIDRFFEVLEKAIIEFS